MKIKTISLFIIIFGIIFFDYGCIQAQSKSEKNVKMKTQAAPDMKDWNETSKKAAREMMEKYGPASEVTNDMLIWNNNGVWLKTIVYKNGLKHDFPSPHADVIEQWINYRVLPDKFDPVAKFDGSISTNRTAGTISSRCESEAMNMLALNLAHEIVSGTKSIEKARQDYATQGMALMKGEKSAYTQKLNFIGDKSAPDPDKPYETEVKIGMDGTDGK